jgi:hypothetical protein
MLEEKTLDHCCICTVTYAEKSKQVSLQTYTQSKNAFTGLKLLPVFLR